MITRSSPSHNSHTTLTPTRDRMSCTGETENNPSSAQIINYGRRIYSKSVGSTAKDLLISTSTPTLKLLLCTAHHVCTCFHNWFHHITQQMLMLFLTVTFSTTNKQPNTTHWNYKPVDNYCKSFFSLCCKMHPCTFPMCLQQ